MDTARQDVGGKGASCASGNKPTICAAAHKQAASTRLGGRSQSAAVSVPDAGLLLLQNNQCKCVHKSISRRVAARKPRCEARRARVAHRPKWLAAWPAERPEGARSQLLLLALQQQRRERAAHNCCLGGGLARDAERLTQHQPRQLLPRLLLRCSACMLGRALAHTASSHVVQVDVHGCEA